MHAALLPLLAIIIMVYLANVTLERRLGSTDMVCPGDTISFTCSIYSNSENLELVWTVTLPGSQPVTVTYNNSFPIDMSNLPNVNFSMLTFFEQGVRADIEITFTNSINGSDVTCGTGNLTDDVLVHTLSGIMADNEN